LARSSRISVPDASFRCPMDVRSVRRATDRC
jgi:hypothetical protein